MKLGLRRVGIALLLALLTIPGVAQDNDTTVTAAGSRVVLDLLQTLTDASETNSELTLSINGSTAGLAAFCQGEVDIAGATRPISVDEEASCTQNTVEYAEYLIGYDAVALVAHPGLTFAQCLSQDNLNAIFAPSAANQIVDWNQSGITEATASIPLSVYLPPDDTTTFNMFDDLVEGLGLRADVTVEADASALIRAVSQTEGAIGIVNANAVADLNDVQVVELQLAGLEGCFAPTVENIESRQYGAASRLFVYVNQASAPKTNDLLTYIVDPAAAEIVSQAGYIAPSEAVYTTNQAILAGDEEVGRQFSLEVTAFEIPASIVGSVNIGGASNLVAYITNATTQFNTQYPGVTFTTTIEGIVAGTRQLCNGEIDLMASSRSLTEEEIANCTANNITTETIELGQTAVILVANVEDTFLSCLTQDQVMTIWGSLSEAERWVDVDESFPDAEMLLIAPPLGGAAYTDLLLTPAEGAPMTQRDDTAEVNADAIYRATAVSNTTGLLTYMSWKEYQTVLDEGLEGLQIVAIDGGSGCINPSQETIMDGSYPYTQSNLLIANRQALSRTEVQSFIWYLFSDENYSLIEDAGFIGVDFATLPELRGELQTLYSDAIATASTAPETPDFPEALTDALQSLEATAEVTPEATIEVTPEATAETEGD